MNATQQQIEAVRKAWPAWDDWTIQRHLQQQQRLSVVAEQQRRQRLAECLAVIYEVRQ